ncbi:ABC transporter permease [Microbacterium indicum]|uniref:ABC transporter permease n=1 Tax=Microbacterium indicum TaxID=358100 RepID=UPI0003FA2573|nr:ABC transporter permease [Microbacterium indicum]
MTTALSTPQATWLVAEREVSTRLRSKPFIITTAMILALIVVGMIVSNVLLNRETTTTVAASGSVAAQLEGAEGIEITPAETRADATALVEQGDVDAAVIADDQSPTGLTVIADTEAPDVLIALLSQAPTVELLDPEGGFTPLRYIMSLAFALVFMMSAMTFALPVATSVVEEKATRVVEILITAIPARALLAGKVLGNTILAVGQIVLIVIALAIGLVATGQTDILRSLSAPLLWFAVFFLVGFLLISTLFAATGSLVSRQEDINQSITPVMYIVMIPYMLVIFFNTNPTVMSVLSYIPFSAPVSMPIRLYFHEAAWWEPLVALVIAFATVAVVLGLAAKIYENSLLRMGQRVKWAEALRPG